MKQMLTLIFTLLCFTSCSFIEDFGLTECVAKSYSVKKREWTMMYYMAADNNLESDAINDINVLESLDFEQKNVSAVCLIDRSVRHDETNANWSGTRLYEISKDIDGENGIIVSQERESDTLALTLDTPTKLNMADGRNLQRFLEYCYENYPAEHYALVLWGHSGGYKTLFFDDFSSDTIPLVELKTSIENSLINNSMNKLDLVCFNSAFSCNLETIWELRNITDTIFASVDGVNSTGIDYKTIFSQYLSSPIENQNLVDNFASQQKNSLVFTNNVVEVQDAFNRLAKVLVDYIKNDVSLSILKKIFLEDTKSYIASTLPADKFLSIYDVCLQIEQNIDSLTSDSMKKNEILSIVEELKTAITTCVKGSGEISVFLTTILKDGILSAGFDTDYVQGSNSFEQIDFIEDTNWWTPTKDRKSSLLDTLFF